MMRKIRRLFQDRRVVFAVCGVLCVLLLVLIICERRAPEAGSDLVRGLVQRVTGTAKGNADTTLVRGMVQTVTGTAKGDADTSEIMSGFCAAMWRP